MEREREAKRRRKERGGEGRGRRAGGVEKREVGEKGEEEVDEYSIVGR